MSYCRYHHKCTIDNVININIFLLFQVYVILRNMRVNYLLSPSLLIYQKHILLNRYPQILITSIVRIADYLKFYLHIY